MIHFSTTFSLSIHTVETHIVEQSSRGDSLSEFLLERNKSNNLKKNSIAVSSVKIRRPQKSPQEDHSLSSAINVAVLSRGLRNPSARKRRTSSMHHPRFTLRSFTRHWLRLKTVIHTRLSHFSYAIATPWCTVHYCRACTSRLDGCLPPCSAISLHHSCSTE